MRIEVETHKIKSGDVQAHTIDFRVVSGCTRVVYLKWMDRPFLARVFDRVWCDRLRQLAFAT